MKKRTFAMIKPDAVACHYTGQIITLASFFQESVSFYDLRSGGRHGT